MQVFGGPLRPCLRTALLLPHPGEGGGKKNHEKCYRYWLRLTGKGAELVNEIPEGLVGGKLI